MVKEPRATNKVLYRKKEDRWTVYELRKFVLASVRGDYEVNGGGTMRVLEASDHPKQ